MRWPTAALLALLVRAGCAGLEPKAGGTVQSAGDLRLSGRLSVQIAGSSSGRATGGNAGFELTGNPAAGQLALSTPLGNLLARASWRDGRVALQTNNDERRFDTLDALTRELLGEAIPVAALFDWLQGRPWPQSTHLALNDGQGFEQLGWQIDLSRLQQGLIIATRLSLPVVTLRARIDP